MNEQTNSSVETTKIHPLAIVSPKAKLGAGVEVGPFAVIEDDVEVGEGTKLLSGAILRNGARIGRECTIHPYAVVGGEPQDLKFKGEESVAVSYTHLDVYKRQLKNMLIFFYLTLQSCTFSHLSISV